MSRATVRSFALAAAASATVGLACLSSSPDATPSPSAREPPPDGGEPPASSGSGASDAGSSQHDAEPASSACPGGFGEAEPDVTVTVRADRGPHGASEPVRAGMIRGMNVADWRAEDYVPAPSGDFVTLLSALRPGVLRWPAGHRSQEYVWARGGPGQRGDWVLTPEQVDAFVALARAVSAEPLVGINVKRGTVAAAKDLASFMNERGDGVRWFYVGNEPDLTDGETPGPEAFAEDLLAYASALREVDPAARVVAPEMLTGAHVGGINGTRDWMTPILTRAGSVVDAISFHYYPLDSGQDLARSSATVSIAHLFQERAPDWHPAGMSFADEIMPALAAARDAYAKGASIWITEIAEDPGPGAGAGVSDTLAAALWVGDVLGRYAEYGPGAMLRWIFNSSPEQAYGLLGEGDVPRPTYGAYWLYAQVGDRFVDARSSARAEIAAHASLRDDGALTVVLVNKSRQSHRARLAISGFAACRADELVLDGDALESKAFTVQGEPLTADAVRRGISPSPVDASRRFDVVVPPSSMRVVAYWP